ncbi:DUF167 family protein [Pseudoxanthobacter sp.]|uniref:DUF167 family protein n=1 Tax=Pseudoxanthobacter sp. TaxID=1925742 RepID=UPI002FE03935
MSAPARPWSATADGLMVRVRLTPRGGRDAVDGLQILSDGTAVLAARVRAVPEKGAANTALEHLLAAQAGVPRSAVSVTAGSTARIKTVRLAGEAGRLAAALEAALAKG